MLKVSRNLRANALGLFRSEFIAQPYHWVKIALAFVASAYPVAKRNNVSWYCAGTFWRGNWYPVIHRQYVPQSSRPSAYRTAIIKIVQTVLPVIGSEVIRKASLPSAAALRVHIGFNDIPAARFVWISILPVPIVLAYLHCVRFTIGALSFADMFRVSLLPARYTFAFFVHIVQTIELVSFWMFAVPLLKGIACTLATIALATIFITLLFVEIRNRLNFTAICAALRGDCIHSITFLLCPKEVAARAVGLSAFSLIRLGYTPSIPRITTDAIAQENVK